MQLEYKIIDAFTTRPFGGNPAAVIVLSPDHQFADKTLQAIALEFNLSETAFITPRQEKGPDGSPIFGLRWFTPTVEVPLCGHATLASASVLFQSGIIDPSMNVVTFSTLSGILTARRSPGTTQVELDFPAGSVVPLEQLKTSALKEAVAKSTNLQESMITNVGGGTPGPAYTSFGLVELDPSVDLKNLKVDVSHFTSLTPLNTFVLTNKSTISGVAYNLRVFAPDRGIPEDPVTGSAHSFVASYWAKKLGVEDGSVMAAKQDSDRGGDVCVIWEQATSRVKLRGETRLAAEGRLYL